MRSICYPQSTEVWPKCELGLNPVRPRSDPSWSQVWPQLDPVLTPVGPSSDLSALLLTRVRPINLLVRQAGYLGLTNDQNVIFLSFSGTLSGSLTQIFTLNHDLLRVWSFLLFVDACFCVHLWSFNIAVLSWEFCLKICCVTFKWRSTFNRFFPPLFFLSWGSF